MDFKAFLRKTVQVVDVTTKVVNSGPLQIVLPMIPGVNSVVGALNGVSTVVHGVDVLVPGDNNVKKKAAMDALGAQYPGIDPRDLSIIIENAVASMRLLQKTHGAA